LPFGDSPLKARFLVLPTKLDDGLCKRMFVAAAEGTVEVDGRRLAEGDVLVVAHGLAVDVRGPGLAAYAEANIQPCPVRSRPAPSVVHVRAAEARELTWAQGTMSAHLDVETDRAPEAYLGRLAGTGAVGEHTHAGSWEILFAVEASGTFTLDGTPHRLASRQVLAVPAGTKHAWTPDPGHRLKALQMYWPPGPEQRFRALASPDAGR
jgi:mannose-6-phosphate isomerase-like protein (cupin superfamily)